MTFREHSAGIPVSRLGATAGSRDRRTRPARLLLLALGAALSGALAGCLSLSEPELPFERPPATWTGFPDSAAVERALRDNLGAGTRARRFLEKCRAGETVRVGFIGGSITDGFFSTRHSNRYTTRFVAMLQATYPRARFVPLVAGIGSTGSRYGVSRLRSDIPRPDLLVIEFAVNDFTLPEDEARATFEGMLRQSLQDPETVVMTLFTMKGDGRNTQASEARIGAHYGTQSVGYRDAVWALIEETPEHWWNFFHDDPHPNDFGHATLARLLYAGLLRAAASAPEERPMPPPLYSDLYEHAGLLVPGDTSVRVSGGWQRVVGPHGRMAWRSAGAAPDTLVLRTRRRELTLGYKAAPKNVASVRIEVDGGRDTVIRSDFRFELTLPIIVFSSDTSRLRTVRVIRSGGPAFRVDHVLYAGPPE